MTNRLDELLQDLFQDKELLGNSKKWANWMSQLTLFTCQYCKDTHGLIIDLKIPEPKPNIPAHPQCKCKYVPMRTKQVGTATNDGKNGADYYIMIYGILPDYYVDKNTLNQLGWNSGKKKVSSILPGKMIGGDTYKNLDEKLPSLPGRIWYEADINYTQGKRNGHRILFSNDGLIFVSYDHYHTFYEITK